MTGAPFRRIGAVLLLVIGGGLGAGMSLAGLFERTFGSFPSGLARWLGLPMLLGMGIPSYTLAWTLLCLGTFWWGAVCAFTLRPAWGWIVLTGVAALSLAFPPAGTGIALAACLVALGWRYSRGITPFRR